MGVQKLVVLYNPTSNTETKDLWDALGLASGFDVASMMNNWVKEEGYPLVHLNLGTQPSFVLAFIYKLLQESWSQPKKGTGH